MMPSHFASGAHAAIALNLIALVSGLLLLNKACGTEFFCKKTGKFFGGLVVIVSLLSILCLGYLCYQKSCARPGTGSGMWQHPPMGEAPMGTPPSEPGK